MLFLLIIRRSRLCCSRLWRACHMFRRTWFGRYLTLPSFWASGHLLRPRLPSLNNLLPALPLLAMFAFFPVAMALLQGQDSILLLFLYGLAFSALATGRAFVAGVCLGLALFKFQLVLPFVVVLLVRRQWKAVAGFSLTAFVLLLVSAAVVGWSGVMAYPGFVLRLDSQRRSSGIDPRDMPNLRGLVAGSLHLAGLPAMLLIIVLSIALVALVGALVACATRSEVRARILAVPDSHDHCQLPPVRARP